MTSLEGLIFDFDGLILDTEMPNYLAWEEIYQKYGCHLPPSEWVRCIGTSAETFDPYADLEARLGRPLDRISVGREQFERFVALTEAQPLLPGVERLLSEASRAGLRLGVASSSSRAWVKGHLERRGLLPFFTSIRTRDDVTRVKPDPELYLTVLADLSLRAGRAAALEDSLHGVVAAKRAGLYCVAVPNELTCDLPLDQADLRLSSLAELDLETLSAAMAKSSA